jgi:8-oxo-dGTP pyrophosphatase MutT (NUDIX family)
MTGTPYLVERNPSYFEYQLPISLKAVIVWRGMVPLLKNEKDEWDEWDEWELPGGKLEVGEDPKDCLRREILEELAWDVVIGEPFHAWVYQIRPDRHVFVLTYSATYEGDSEPSFSHEHKELALVPVNDAIGAAVAMPASYKDAIRAATTKAGELTDRHASAPDKTVQGAQRRGVAWPLRLVPSGSYGRLPLAISWLSLRRRRTISSPSCAIDLGQP